MPVTLILLAQAAASDPTAVYAQWGLLGVAVVALAGFARSAYNRERDRADRLEQQVTTLQQRIVDDVTPLVVHAMDVIEAQSKTLDKLRAQRRPT